MNRWIEWVKQLKAIAQNGLSFSRDPYDLDRYRQLTDISHGMIADLAGAPREKVDQFFLPDQGYATPKVDLRAGVVQNGTILLARERSDGGWSLPGGWADVGESPMEGIEREVFEETGFTVKARRLIAIRDRSLHSYRPRYPHHVYKLFFLCDLLRGEAKENTEISEIAFFHPQNLPPLSQARVIPEDIDMVFQYAREKNLPVYCD